jgi:DNA polymerase-3 subunit chi
MEIAFYHLSKARVDQALPILLERTLAKGWRAIVQTNNDAQVSKLNQDLWAYKPESFLPHGVKSDPDLNSLPIYLTASNDNPNASDVRFFIDGVEMQGVLQSVAAPKERAIFLFDGVNEDELKAARDQWRTLKDAGFSLVYYQQSEQGNWLEKHRSGNSAS